MNGWRWLLIYLSAQLAQSETAVNLLSITISCLYFGVLPGFYTIFHSILQCGDRRIFRSLHAKHPPAPVRCNWNVFAHQTHSPTEFAMKVLSKCVIYDVNSILEHLTSCCMDSVVGDKDGFCIQNHQLLLLGHVLGNQGPHHCQMSSSDRIVSKVWGCWPPVAPRALPKAWPHL